MKFWIWYKLILENHEVCEIKIIFYKNLGIVEKRESKTFFIWSLVSKKIEDFEDYLQYYKNLNFIINLCFVNFNWTICFYRTLCAIKKWHL